MYHLYHPRHLKLVYCLTFLIALLFLNACTDKVPTLAKIAKDDVILAFGDSLTYGTGVKQAESYPAVLQNLSQHSVINSGVPGELSADGLNRLAAVLDEHSPALLILCHGGNDLLRKKNKAKLKQNLIEMIKMAQFRQISVVLIGIPEPKLAFMKTAPLYKEIAKQFNIPIEFDIIRRVVSDSSLKSDAVHPNKRGYRLIAESVQQLLLKSGTI